MSVCTAHEDMRDQLRDHEKRIVAPEKSDAEFAIRLQKFDRENRQLDRLDKSTPSLALLAPAGLIIWHIQSFPR